MGKSVKKAVKKVTKKVLGNTIGGKLFKSATKAPKEPNAPDTPNPIPPAVEVAAPKDDADVESGSDTESGKRKTQSRGKNKLTVARSSGRGLNI